MSSRVSRGQLLKDGQNNEVCSEGERVLNKHGFRKGGDSSFSACHRCLKATRRSSIHGEDMKILFLACLNPKTGNHTTAERIR